MAKSVASSSRVRAANLALGATTTLTLAKMAVALATGSIGVLSEAIHSGLDLLSSIITFFVVRASSKPADPEHPFGHGKIESLSALVEATLLLVAGGYIAYEGVAVLSGGDAHAHQVQMLGWGLAVTGASVLINLAVYLQNRHVGRAEESLAIETNAYHFLTDVFSSLAVFIGLVVIQVTGWVWVDAAVAMAVAIYIFSVGVVQIKKCVDELSDVVVPEGEMRSIHRVLKKRAREYISYHELRARKSGAVRHIDLHLEVCQDERVEDAHSVCDRIEEDLQSTFRVAHVNIHIEPCGNHGPKCVETCQFKGVRREARYSSPGLTERPRHSP